MTAKIAPKISRPRRIDGAPLEYEPINELGVVYLFAHEAKKLGLRVEKIGAPFPDCIAYKGTEQIRIEFEYRSSNFRRHGHNPRQIDWIVCWIHDWTEKPARVRVVELRSKYGLGFNVWFSPVGGHWKEMLSSRQRFESWTVPRQASKGDLVLYYKTSPEKWVEDIFRITSPVEHTKAGWKSGKDWFASITRVARLKAPLHLDQMRLNRVVGRAGLFEGTCRGALKRPNTGPTYTR